MWRKKYSIYHIQTTKNKKNSSNPFVQFNIISLAWHLGQTGHWAVEWCNVTLCFENRQGLEDGGSGSTTWLSPYSCEWVFSEISEITTAEVSTAAQLSWWLEQGNVFVQSIWFLLVFVLLKEPFLCVPDEASQNTLWYDLTCLSVSCVLAMKASEQLLYSTAGCHQAE